MHIHYARIERRSRDEWLWVERFSQSAGRWCHMNNFVKSCNLLLLIHAKIGRFPVKIVRRKRIHSFRHGLIIRWIFTIGGSDMLLANLSNFWIVDCTAHICCPPGHALFGQWVEVVSQQDDKIYDDHNQWIASCGSSWTAAFRSARSPPMRWLENVGDVAQCRSLALHSKPFNFYIFLQLITSDLIFHYFSFLF